MPSNRNICVEVRKALDLLLVATNQLLLNDRYYDSLYNSMEIIGKGFLFDCVKLFIIDEKSNCGNKTKVIEWKDNDEINISLNETLTIELCNKLIQENALFFNIEDKETSDYFIHQGIKTVNIISIQYQNKLRGFIAFFNLENKRELEKEIIQLMKLYSNALSQAIERHNREKEIEKLSFRDSLTNLYNRRYFEQELKRMASENNLPISMIMGDVNGLKLVNDSFGHAHGDLLLKTAAEIFVSQKRENDLICRWGGDEFVILLPDTSLKEAKLIVDKLLEKVSKTYVNFIPMSISLAASTLSDNLDINKMFKEAENLMYKQKLKHSPIIKRRIIQSIMDTLYARSDVEKEHAKRVSDLSAQIGEAMSFDEYGVRHLRAVGLYHDIGKIAIDESLLNKDRHLTKEENAEVKRHAEVGYHILSSVNETSDIADFILKHHERIDGSGYPYGLKDDDIPLITKILTVAEAYDRMVFNHSHHRRSLTKQEAIHELIKYSCTQFDHIIVRTFVERVLKQKWYSVLYGVNNTVIKCGESFDSLAGVFVKDPSDLHLSLRDITIIGKVDTTKPGKYNLIYTIENVHGEMERVMRKVVVGDYKSLNMFKDQVNRWSKVEIQGADFEYTATSNELTIDLVKGGRNPWSSQLIFKGITLEKGKQYVISFDANTNMAMKEIQLSIGYLDVENNYWHSFISTSENKFYITPYKQTSKLIFTMEKDTHLSAEIKFEVGTGENTQLNISNIELFEFIN